MANSSRPACSLTNASNPPSARFRTIRQIALERLRLELEHAIAIDETIAIQPSGSPRELTDAIGLARAIHFLDPQVQRAAKATARRKVGARLLRKRRGNRRERIDQRDPGILTVRPATEPAQIAQIADAPAPPRPRGIQLNRPAPGGQTVGDVAAGRGGDQPGRLARGDGESRDTPEADPVAAGRRQRSWCRLREGFLRDRRAAAVRRQRRGSGAREGPGRAWPVRWPGSIPAVPTDARRGRRDTRVECGMTDRLRGPSACAVLPPFSSQSTRRSNASDQA